ncbi:MAG: hypothetical protein QXG86_00900 [Candidatus Woesearchaeota archaeon]
MRKTKNTNKEILSDPQFDFYNSINYDSLYRKNFNDFALRVYEFNKLVRAYFICEKKILEEEFNKLKENIKILEKIYSKNLEIKNRILEKENNEPEYFSSIEDNRKSKKILKIIENVEICIEDFFYNAGKYKDFYSGNNEQYKEGSLEKLILIVNNDKIFNNYYTLSESFKFLDTAAYPYLKVIEGIYEFLNKNEFISPSDLENKLLSAYEYNQTIFFYDKKRFDNPSAPKIKVTEKNNEKNKYKIAIPQFFEEITEIIRKMLRKANPEEFEDRLALS